MNKIILKIKSKNRCVSHIEYKRSTKIKKSHTNTITQSAKIPL